MYKTNNTSNTMNKNMTEVDSAIRVSSNVKMDINKKMKTQVMIPVMLISKLYLVKMTVGMLLLMYLMIISMTNM